MIHRFVVLVGLVSLLGIAGSIHADEAANKKNAVPKVIKEAPLFGRIIDELGKPVTDARLTLNGPEYLKAKTDENGFYQFADLKKLGVYRLRVESRRWVGFTRYSDQIEIALDPARNTQEDLTLERACLIKATVVDENDDPILATLYSHSMNVEESNGEKRASTNVKGQGTLYGIKRSKSKHIVIAQTKGYAQSREYVSVDPDKIAECKIVLKKGKTVRGKVMCKDGNPAEGWTIVARPTWQKFGPQPVRDKIGKDGSFELHDVGEEKQTVYVRIPQSEYSWTTKKLLDDVVLDASNPVNATVDHPSPASLTYLSCRIRWIGKPVERGFEISAYCRDLDHHASDFVKSDDKEIKLGPVPKGIYRIRLRSGSIECMNLRGIKNLDNLDQVKVPNEKPLQIVLRVKGRPHLQGKVIDAITKQPIKKFHYRVTKVRTLSGPNYVTGNEWNLVFNDKGEFFVDVSGPGVYYTRILADGYAMKQTIEVNTDETPDKVVEVALEKGVDVRGKVVDATGKGVANAKVRAVSLAGGSYGDDIQEFVTDMRAIQTDESGEFQFQNLAKGYDKIRVDHKDYVYETISVHVKDQIKPQNITLKAGATIQGTLYDHLGEPAANELVYFHKDDNFSGRGGDQPGLFAQTTTDKNGHFQVTRIPEKIVHLSRENAWETNGVARHVVKTRDGQTHTIDLGGTNEITGKLLVDDVPLGETRIQLTGDDSVFGKMVMYGRTATDGSFTLHGAPPGNWVLNRAIVGSRGDWVKVREVDVPVEDDVDLGEMNSPSGTLTIKFKGSNETELPSNLRVELQQYISIHDLGRQAARLAPRTDVTEPYVFENVVPGDYVVDVNFGQFEIRKRIKVTPDDLGKTIELPVPTGNANVRLTLLNREDKPSGVTVRLWSADGTVRTRMQGKKDDDDKPYHEINGLADGNYIVRGYFQLSGPGLAEIEVTDGKDIVKEIKLPQKWTSPDTNISFNVYDEQGAFVRGRVEVISDEAIEARQGDYAGSTRLVVPKGSTFTARINVPGFEIFEKEFKEIATPQTLDVILKRTK